MKIFQGRGGKLKMEREGKKYENVKKSRGSFFFFFPFFFSFLFFFFFILFWLSLFETTEICSGSTKMGNFYPEKAYLTPGTKSGKVSLPPLKNIPLTPLVACRTTELYFRTKPITADGSPFGLRQGRI